MEVVGMNHCKHVRMTWPCRSQAFVTGRPGNEARAGLEFSDCCVVPCLYIQSTLLSFPDSCVILCLYSQHFSHSLTVVSFCASTVNTSLIP